MLLYAHIGIFIEIIFSKPHLWRVKHCISSRCKLSFQVQTLNKVLKNSAIFSGHRSYGRLVTESWTTSSHCWLKCDSPEDISEADFFHASFFTTHFFHASRNYLILKLLSRFLYHNNASTVTDHPWSIWSNQSDIDWHFLMILTTYNNILIIVDVNTYLFNYYICSSEYVDGHGFPQNHNVIMSYSLSNGFVGYTVSKDI